MSKNGQLASPPTSWDSFLVMLYLQDLFYIYLIFTFFLNEVITFLFITKTGNTVKLGFTFSQQMVSMETKSA